MNDERRKKSEMLLLEEMVCDVSVDILTPLPLALSSSNVRVLHLKRD